MQLQLSRQWLAVCCGTKVQACACLRLCQHASDSYMWSVFHHPLHAGVLDCAYNGNNLDCGMQLSCCCHQTLKLHVCMHMQLMASSCSGPDALWRFAGICAANCRNLLSGVEAICFLLDQDVGWSMHAACVVKDCCGTVCLNCIGVRLDMF